MVRKMKRITWLILIISAAATTIISAGQPISFTLKAAPSTNSVHLVGDFNGWSKTANPMFDRNGDGKWETTINLEPGSYQYRFLLDSVKWIKDPLNLHWTGEFSNSILWVKHPQEPELKNIKPEMGSVIRSAHLEIEADYIDGIGQPGIDLHGTTILLNQAPQKFIFNKALGKIECSLAGLADGEYYFEIHAQDLAGNKARLISSFFIVNHSNQAPIADAGHTIIASVAAMVHLNSGVSYDPDQDPLQKYEWKMISSPAGSVATLEQGNSPSPFFIADKIGRYVVTLRVSDGNVWSQPDSVDVHAIVRRDCPVEFSLSDSVFQTQYGAAIGQAAVAGEFNNWSATENLMHDSDRDGAWTTQISLDPGEYEYKFVVNGAQWIPDPENPVQVPDGWNGYNSVMSASSNFAPIVDVKTTCAAGKISFDASGSHSRNGTALSYVWRQDIKNPRRFDLAPQQKISFPVPEKQGTYFFYLDVTDQQDVRAQKTFMLNVNNEITKVMDFSESPEWAKDAIIYEVFVRKFTPEGNLQALTNKIPYLKTLGINCIWLMPIWDGPTSHGYGPSSFFDIEPDYGTLDDFKNFVERAHQSGIRVILDFIANHTSDQHPYFLSAYQNPSSPFRDWYRWQPKPEDVGYYRYEFHNDWDTLPNLNYENLNVRRYILDAATHWAQLGVDGFRCDVAWGVPHDFWKLLRRSLKAINPEFLLINEVLPRSPKYHHDEFDMSYDTDFYGNLLDVMNGRKPLAAIDYGLKKTEKNYPAHAQDFRYIENHDMERFIRQFGMRRTKLAATLLLTIPGTPLIYYGQETGLEEMTPPMVWENQNDSLFSFYQTIIQLRRNYSALRRGDMVNAATNRDESVYAYVRKDSQATFLIILNFSKSVAECQLSFPEGIVELPLPGRLIADDVVSSEKAPLDFDAAGKLNIKLEPETPYLFRLN